MNTSKKTCDCKLNWKHVITKIKRGKKKEVEERRVGIIIMGLKLYIVNTLNLLFLYKKQTKNGKPLLFSTTLTSLEPNLVVFFQYSFLCWQQKQILYLFFASFIFLLVVSYIFNILYFFKVTFKKSFENQTFKFNLINPIYWASTKFKEMY